MITARWALLALLAIPSVFRGQPLTPLATFDFPFTGYDLQFDAPRGCLFVPDFNGQRLLRVSLTNGATLQEFELTGGPVYGTVSPNREKLYFGLWQTNMQAGTGAVVEIDLRTMQRTSQFQVNARPGYMVATDNRVLVVSSPDGTLGHSLITAYAAASGTVLSQQPGSTQKSAQASDRLALHPAPSSRLLHGRKLFHHSGQRQCGAAIGSQPDNGRPDEKRRLVCQLERA